MELVIVTGVSGSGKSTVLDALEDVGYFGIDSLPSPLITQFVTYLLQQGHPGKSPVDELATAKLTSVEGGRFALHADCLDADGVQVIREAIKTLRDAGIVVSLLFLDCQDEIIVQRYRETRRPHPLLKTNSGLKTISDALAKEREVLAGLRAVADRVIDTTGYSPHDLRKVIEEQCRHERQLEIFLLSFGFKFGVPNDIDLLVDVRFLPNPHFVPELKPLTGENSAVAEYVFSSGDSQEFLQKYLSLLEFLIPRYRDEGKRYLSIAVGCTGGKHRSVAVAERLQAELAERKLPVKLQHRDSAR